jgi:hypothetical protein
MSGTIVKANEDYTLSVEKELCDRPVGVYRLVITRKTRNETFSHEFYMTKEEINRLKECL